MPCTRHRVFLATLIVAAKYLNDSSPKNKHWASFAKLFDPAEINLMEKQLLFLMDYDLRFDEAEAISHFAPFMHKRTEAAKETRAAAVTRAKARVQAQVSMPPTPPEDAVADATSVPPPASMPASTSTSGVQSLVKRLSSTYLSIASGNTVARPRPLSRASSSSTLGTASASGESESGTSSSAYSSPATSVSSMSDSEPDKKEADAGMQKLSLGHIPGHDSRQGRKVSTASTCTIKGDCATSRISLSPSSSSKASLGRGAGKRNISISFAQSHPSGGFLSRMFGSNKTQEKEKDSSEVPEPLEAHGSSNALRRLAHSKSTLFRGQQAQQTEA